MKANRPLHSLMYAGALTLCASAAHAADWSVTSLSYRYGTHFAEPFNNNHIAKNILNLSHTSGYKYGSNYFSADLLMSDDKDPASAGSKDGAQDVYLIYRHTLDATKVTGRPFNLGPVRAIGLTAGFDYQSKNDAGYNSKKRMLVLGPTVSIDVPGFLAISVLALWESNAPYSSFTRVATPRYHYDVHPAVVATWGIPIGSLPLSFEGFANFIASKGTNEFGRGTAPETNIDIKLMYDLSAITGSAKNALRVGFEYQYWRNKFGNDASGPAGKGAFARTPQIRLEYQF